MQTFFFFCSEIISKCLQSGKISLHYHHVINSGFVIGIKGYATLNTHFVRVGCNLTSSSVHTSGIKLTYHVGRKNNSEANLYIIYRTSLGYVTVRDAEIMKMSEEKKQDLY